MNRGRSLRQKPRISYSEIEEPDLDEYVFCDECGDYVFEYCSIHGPLLVVPDDKLPPRGLPPCVPRAARTVPREFLHLAPSDIPGAGIGVFATLTLPKGVRFGPYVGERTKEAHSDYCWQLYDGSRRATCVVDGGDAERSNWLRYVNCARHCAEQNLLAYQYRGHLYYRTIKIIPRFTELLVFYGAQFARSLRVNLRLYNTIQGYNQLFGNHGTSYHKEPKSNNSQTSEKQSKEEDHPVSESCVVAKEAPSLLKLSKNNVTDNKPPEKKLKTLEEPSTEETQRNPKRTTIKSEEIKKTDKKPSITQDNMALIKAANEHACNMSNYKTNDARILKFHMKMKTHSARRHHTGEKPYACEICEKKFADKSYFGKHMRIHTGEKLYACKICDKKFTWKLQLEGHFIMHTGEKPYACEVCDKKFTRKSSLELHIRIHTGEKPYACDICDKKFTWKLQLEGHFIMHTGEKPYACEVCDKKFTRKSSLELHIRIHTGEKPYACDICDKKFTWKPNLERHIRIHTGEKPYACEICDKKFTRKPHLKRHIRMHTGEKPYACEICDKKFTQKSSLELHMRIHTGEKPYACEICDKKFTDKRTLRKHIRIHK